MFTITERDRKLAAQGARWKETLAKAFPDLFPRKPLDSSTTRAQLIAQSSLEEVLARRTELLRLKYCQGDENLRVQAMVTSQALQDAVLENGLARGPMTEGVVLDVVRKYVSSSIDIGCIKGPFLHQGRGSLTLPGHSYYSFFLSIAT